MKCELNMIYFTLPETFGSTVPKLKNRCTLFLDEEGITTADTIN
jgi:hypothetical protein